MRTVDMDHAEDAVRDANKHERVDRKSSRIVPDHLNTSSPLAARRMEHLGDCQVQGVSVRPKIGTVLASHAQLAPGTARCWTMSRSRRPAACRGPALHLVARRSLTADSSIFAQVTTAISSTRCRAAFSATAGVFDAHRRAGSTAANPTVCYGWDEPTFISAMYRRIVVSLISSSSSLLKQHYKQQIHDTLLSRGLLAG
jgi:hypothetical protein